MVSPTFKTSTPISKFPACSWLTQEYSMQLAETKLKVDTVERERDFYFDKLRDIEILCQMPELQSIPVHPVACLQQQQLCWCFVAACPALCSLAVLHAAWQEPLSYCVCGHAD